MKVLLTHGYFIHEDPAEARIMKPYPPMGLLCLSAWLKKKGIAHEVFDTTFDDIKKFKARIENYKPGIVGIYSTLMTRLTILEIIAFLKGYEIFAGTRIIIGGPDARHHAETYLSKGADFIVPGEGEEALVELIGAISSGQTVSLNKIRGICFLDKDNRFIRTEERNPMAPEEIESPSYDGIDVPGYLKTWETSHGYTSMSVNSMRGCPFACNWCSKAVFGNSYRRRSPGSVVEEMTMLVNRFDPDQVWFTDDVFTISKEWMREFSREVQKENLRLPYECITRSDCLDEEIIGILKGSGCRKVWIGTESGSQHVIDLMNRRIDLARSAGAIRRLKELKISVGMFIMLGYHGERKMDIFRTARFLEKTLPDDLTIGLAYPIKGTKYYETVEPFFNHPYNWETMNERQIRFKRPYSDMFYRFSTRYLFNIYKFNKANPGLHKVLFFFKAVISKSYILLFN
jgi:anaerobic magnesium-protoporphyrin IX monomethyl ester cyclase